MAREGFVVYHELLSFIDPFTDEERGRIFTAMLKYSESGEIPSLTGNERFIWPAIQSKIDRDKEAYEKKCMQMQANASKSKQLHTDAPKSTPTETETESETVTETATGTETALSTKERGESAHSYGEYGRVKLTDTQYAKLLADLGQEELDRCIQYIDESAQQTGNKNKWKDWNLIIRKCSRDGWGKNNSSSKQQSKPSKFVTAEDYKPPKNTKTPDELWRMIDSI